jgi:hypothetical protein
LWWKEKMVRVSSTTSSIYKRGGEVFKPVLARSPILKEPLILVLKFLCELENLVVSLW